MRPLYTTLALAISAACQGITEAPAVVTPAMVADCPLTNSIPLCGVCSYHIVSFQPRLATQTDSLSDPVPHVCWEGSWLFRRSRPTMRVQICQQDTRQSCSLRHTFVWATAWIIARVGSCRHLHAMCPLNSQAMRQVFVFQSLVV